MTKIGYKRRIKLTKKRRKAKQDEVNRKKEKENDKGS